MSQEIQMLNIKDLVLWTENPRDPITAKATDQDIVDKALDDKLTKWTLAKLAKEMGEHYDFSELPTVVFHGKIPVIYDGNRRMILAKLKHNLVEIKDSEKFNLPDIPEEIPCNVCSKNIALKNIYRKHSDNGSWKPLERDIFLYKHMKEPKSTFLIIEESTGLISAMPHLNQRFVKEEVFKDDLLKEMGFEIASEKLRSVHDDKEARTIFSDISQKVQNKNISTRINRGKVMEILDKRSQKLIDKNKDKHFHIANVNFNDSSAVESEAPKAVQTKRVTQKDIELFGGKLYLKTGVVSNLYRDIVDLYKYYIDNKATLSSSFSSLIRMALRLLCECAAKDSKKTMDKYIQSHFVNAKKDLDQDIKTTLSTQNINENSIIQLLHTGAHNYQAANNFNQTIAISIILGEILKITHGKE